MHAYTHTHIHTVQLCCVLDFDNGQALARTLHGADQTLDNEWSPQGSSGSSTRSGSGPVRKGPAVWQGDSRCPSSPPRPHGPEDSLLKGSQKSQERAPCMSRLSQHAVTGPFWGQSLRPELLNRGWWVSSSGRAAMTKYHRPSDLNFFS